MAQLVIAAVGSAIGGSVLGTGVVALGMTGNAIGWAVGSLVGSMFGPKQKGEGPRLSDLTVSSSAYGTPIPYVIGSPRLAGQIIWASNKRELATTTRQGKGGGGSQFTSYTYEVDMLILLADNSVPGLSRVWESGKLVYSRLTSAPGGTVNASAETAKWRRITFYGGGPAQLPDPAYEAAVGSANALAYRGRSTVFLEGLQLGSSGAIQNETFELYDVGVETPADDLTRLQTKFVNASSADESVHLIGSGIAAGSGVLSNGNYQILFDGITDGSIDWTDSGLVLNNNAALTVEWFAKFTEVTVNPIFGINFARLFFGNEELTWTVDGFYAGVNSIALQRQFLGGVWNSAYDAFGPNYKHFAVVFRTTGYYDVYVDGARVWANRPYAYGLAYGKLVLGGTGSPGQTIQVDYSGARVRRQEMYSGASFIPPASPYDWGSAYTTLATIEPGTVPIEQAVTRICLRAGMSAGQFDVAALSSIAKPVRAMAISQVSSARQVLDMLASAYFFEAVASDKIYFRPRAGAPVKTLVYDDLGTAGDGQEAPDPLALIDANELELPAQVALTYNNVDGDYQTDTQYSDRLLSGMRSTNTLTLPMGFTASEAKQIADGMLIDSAVSLLATTLHLGLSHADLEPTDVVIATGPDGSTYRLRLVKRDDTGGVITFDAVLDDPTVLTQSGITAGATASQTVVLPVAETVWQLLDMPMLRDEDDAPGYYVAVSGGGNSNWRTAGVYDSPDSISYDLQFSLSSQAVMGASTTALAAWPGRNVWDETSTVTVAVDGELSSVTSAEIIARRSANTALIGNELMQFRTATLVSPGFYTLTGFLRGRRGTEWAMATHAIGDRFVLLGNAGIRYLPMQVTQLGMLRYVKAATAGQLLSAVAAKSITPMGVPLKPLAPVLASADRATSDTVLHWYRRTRLSTRITGPLPWSNRLGEAVEAYEIDIYADGTYSAIKRTLASVISQVVYTAAQQTADFGAPQTTLYIEVYQLSATVGHGRPLRAAI